MCLGIFGFPLIKSTFKSLTDMFQLETIKITSQSILYLSHPKIYIAFVDTSY